MQRQYVLGREVLRPAVRKNGSENDLTVNVLLEEYKLHRQEILQQLAIYNQQTNYMQLLGLVLVSVAGVVFKEKAVLNALPEVARLFVLCLAACFAFYLVSTVMSAAYMFLILRRRMKEIEIAINGRLKLEVMGYETNVAPRFLTKIFYADGFITPHALSGVWRILLFWGSLITLTFLAHVSLDSKIYHYFYSVTVCYIGVMLAYKYFSLSSPGHERAFEQSYNGRELGNTANLLRAAQWLQYYVALMILLGVYFFSSAADQFGVRALDWLIMLREVSERLMLTGTVVYTALCAIILPTPSEAPLVFFGKVATWKLFVAACIGKAIGSLILACIVGLLARKTAQPPEWLTRNFGDHPFEGTWIGRSSAVLYFACQAIPFAPMRTSTVIYAWSAGLSWTKAGWIVVASGLGTIIRTGLILWLLAVFDVAILHATI